MTTGLEATPHRSKSWAMPLSKYGPRSSTEEPVETQRSLPETRRVFRRSGSRSGRGRSPRSGEYFARTDVQQSAPVAVAPAPPPIAATPAVGTTEFVPEVEQNSPAAIAPSPPLTAATPAVGTMSSFLRHHHPWRKRELRQPRRLNRLAKQSPSLSLLARRTGTPSSPSHPARA